MPPRTRSADRPVPPALRCYVAHGVDLQWRDGSLESHGECPFCGKPKLYVNVESGQGHCKSCQTGSKNGGLNHTLFIQEMWSLARRSTREQDLAAFAQDRGLESDTLDDWGVCRNPVTGEWLIPGYDAEGKLRNLYRYAKVPGQDRMALLGTPGMSHQLFMPSDLAARGVVVLEERGCHTVYVAEGPWDGMALWEVMGSTKDTGYDSYEVTGNRGASLLSKCAVVATPSANTFQEWWHHLFAGRSCVLMYDNDWPVEKDGKSVDGAGYTGARTAAHRLVNSEGIPSGIFRLGWAGAASHTTDLPDGFDVRDWLHRAPPGAERSRALHQLLKKVVQVPKEWVQETELLRCTDWKTLTAAARKALRWPEPGEGLDKGLSVMLAAITSVPSAGDQLWVKIVSPASSGKSVLCEAVSTNREHVKAVSSLRGFHSGYKTDKEGTDDHSLIAELRSMSGGRGCALVTKDGDTLLQSPNLPQILSEARDIYDRVSRAHYRHGVNREYRGLNMSWILCGTASLRQLDHSELGERFLDCVMINEIDVDDELETALRRVYTANREMSIEANGKPESLDNAELVRFKRLCGGYVSHLWNNGRNELELIELDDDRARRCVEYGLFVAHMRARPSDRQKEKAEREMCYRLSAQFLRLAKCLAVVLNRKTLDRHVMSVVKSVCMDTARGRTMEVARSLYRSGEDGGEEAALAYIINDTDAEVRKLLKFMKDVKVVENFKRPTAYGGFTKPRWRLTESFKSLWEKVVESAP